MSAEQPNAEGFAHLPPPIVSHNLSPTVVARTPLRLRPLWIGFTIAGSMTVLQLAGPADSDTTQSSLAQMIIAVLGMAAIVYYFMCVHRLIRVLQEQPSWSSEYTPAGVVWRQLIPLYGLFVLYQWTGDVESYASWRLEVATNAGRWCFLGLFAGFTLANFGLVPPLAGIGNAVIFGALMFLYSPVRTLMGMPAPDGNAAPRYDGTLGLR